MTPNTALLLLLFGVHFAIPGFLLAFPLLLPAYPVQDLVILRVARALQLFCYLVSCPICTRLLPPAKAPVPVAGLLLWLGGGVGAMYAVHPALFVACLAFQGTGSGLAFWPLVSTLSYSTPLPMAMGTATGAVVFGVALVTPWPLVHAYCLAACAGCLIFQILLSGGLPKGGGSDFPLAFILPRLASAFQLALVVQLFSLVPFPAALGVAAASFINGWAGGSFVDHRVHGAVLRKLYVVLLGLLGAGRGLLVDKDIQLWWHAGLGLVAGLSLAAAGDGTGLPSLTLLAAPLVLILQIVVIPEWILPASLAIAPCAFIMLFAEGGVAEAAEEKTTGADLSVPPEEVGPPHIFALGPVDI